MIICPNCGAENPDDKMYCGDCREKFGSEGYQLVSQQSSRESLYAYYGRSAVMKWLVGSITCVPLGVILLMQGLSNSNNPSLEILTALFLITFGIGSIIYIHYKFGKNPE